MKKKQRKLPKINYTKKIPLKLMAIISLLVLMASFILGVYFIVVGNFISTLLSYASFRASWAGLKSFEVVG